MTFVAANLLSISINLLLLLFVVVCLLMTLVILMQRPKQEGLGAAFGGGVTDQVFGARTTNVLQRGTVYLGSLFFVISLLLSVLIGQQNKGIKTVKEEDLAPAVQESEAAEPAIEVVPESLKDELPPEESAPAEAPAPTDVPADAMETPAPAEPSETTTPIETPAPADATPDASSLPADEAPADAPQEP